MRTVQPFHLAVPVSNLEEARVFYHELLGCDEGRSSDQWVDFDFFGHQLVIHEKETTSAKKASNSVDGHDVPIPHFGVVLTLETFERLSEKLQQNNIQFIIEPYTRFKGEVGEQNTMFFEDPSRNALEFKAFKNIDQLFAK